MHSKQIGLTDEHRAGRQYRCLQLLALSVTTRARSGGRQLLRAAAMMRSNSVSGLTGP